MTLTFIWEEGMEVGVKVGPTEVALGVGTEVGGVVGVSTGVIPPGVVGVGVGAIGIVVEVGSTGTTGPGLAAPPPPQFACKNSIITTSTNMLARRKLSFFISDQLLFLNIFFAPTF